MTNSTETEPTEAPRQAADPPALRVFVVAEVRGGRPDIRDSWTRAFDTLEDAQAHMARWNRFDSVVRRIYTLVDVTEVPA